MSEKALQSLLEWPYIIFVVTTWLFGKQWTSGYCSFSVFHLLSTFIVTIQLKSIGVGSCLGTILVCWCWPKLATTYTPHLCVGVRRHRSGISLVCWCCTKPANTNTPQFCVGVVQSLPTLIHHTCGRYRSGISLGCWCLKVFWSEPLVCWWQTLLWGNILLCKCRKNPADTIFCMIYHEVPTNTIHG